jgi:anti-anti-sigma factor
MPVSINVKEKKKNVYSVVLNGSIDTNTYKELEDTIANVTNETTKAIFLEMAGVDYISSIGIKAILYIKKNLEAKDATFAMIDLQPKIEKIFDVMRLLPIFEIFDNMPDADRYIDQIIEEETAQN